MPHWYRDMLMAEDLALWHFAVTFRMNMTITSIWKAVEKLNQESMVIASFREDRFQDNHLQTHGSAYQTGHRISIFFFENTPENLLQSILFLIAPNRSVTHVSVLTPAGITEMFSSKDSKWSLRFCFPGETGDTAPLSSCQQSKNSLIDFLVLLFS